MAYRPPRYRYYSDSEIIKMSLVLYPEEMQYELREDATVLMAAVHACNPRGGGDAENSTMKLSERFWSKVAPGIGCWHWMAGRNNRE